MKILRIACLLVGTALAATLAGSVIQDAPAEAASKQNPFDGSETARRAGAKLYARQCASCHGQNREGGDRSPSLTHSGIYGAPSGTLFWVLTNGALRSGMPSFAHLPAQQRWQIVTFLRDAASRSK